MKAELIKYSHSIGESNFHYQLTAAYRKKIFAYEKVQKLTRAYLVAKADELGVRIVSIEFGPDHAHLFVTHCRKYSASQLIGLFKGYVSRMMRKNHWNLFKHLLWGNKFWTGGYFFRSVGATTAETIKYYIENSQSKHWEIIDYEVVMAGQKTLIDF